MKNETFKYTKKAYINVTSIFNCVASKILYAIAFQNFNSVSPVLIHMELGCILIYNLISWKSHSPGISQKHNGLNLRYNVLDSISI